MKAIQIIQPGEVEVINVPKPVAAMGEVLLKVKYVGFCGSDLSTYLGKNLMVSYPRIPGHEVSAVVEEVGEGVPDTLKKGDKVTVVPYTNCGSCASCKRGRFNACENNETLGVQRDGAMCEYITAPYEKILKVPSLSDKECALIEPLTVGFHAIDRASVEAGDTVMVMGCGMIGAGAIAGAALRGAIVVAVDIDDDKLDTAKKIGATHTINTKKTDLHVALNSLLQGNAPDVVVEAAGNPITYKAAVEEVAFTGRIVCIGYAKSEISFLTKLWVQKELDILGSRNATPKDFDDVISLLKTGTFPADRVLSRVVSIKDSADAFKKWSDNPGAVFKILLEF